MSCNIRRTVERLELCPGSDFEDGWRNICWWTEQRDHTAATASYRHQDRSEGNGGAEESHGQTYGIGGARWGRNREGCPGSNEGSIVLPARDEGWDTNSCADRG